MSDIKFNCSTCNQSLEAPPEMAGQLIECPTCKKTLEIPFPPRPAPAAPPKPIVTRNPVAKPIGGKKVLTRDDLCSGDDVFFAATGVTDGELLRGVRYDSYGARSQSLVMRSRSGTVRVIDTQHRADRIGQYSSAEFR